MGVKPRTGRLSYGNCAQLNSLRVIILRRRWVCTLPAALTNLPERSRTASPAVYQIVGAAFAGEGHSGSRAPSRSTLSAALFAACLASQSSDAAALLHLLKMHGDGVEDVRDENGRTPLHHVCRADDVGLVRLLCQAGADAAAQDCRVRKKATLRSLCGRQIAHLLRTLYEYPVGGRRARGVVSCFKLLTLGRLNRGV